MQVRREVFQGEQIANQAATFSGRQGLQADFVQQRPVFLRDLCAQALTWRMRLGPAEAENEQRQAFGQRQQVLNEFMRGFVQPMQVFEEEHGGLLQGQVLKVTAQCAVDLRAETLFVQKLYPVLQFGRHVNSQETREVWKGFVSVRAEQGAGAGFQFGRGSLLRFVFANSSPGAEYFEKRPITDGLSIVQGAALQPLSRSAPGSVPPPKFADEPRLAQASLARNHHHPTLPVLQAGQERGELRQLRFAAHKDVTRLAGRREARASRLGLAAKDSVSRDALGLAAHFHRAERLTIKEVIDQAMGCAGDLHRAWGGRLLHAGGDVYSVAEGGVLGAVLAAHVAHHRHAGVDAHAHGEI